MLITPASVYLKAILCAVIVLFAMYRSKALVISRMLQQHRSVKENKQVHSDAEHEHPDEHLWQLHSESHNETVYGTLIQAGYRSAGLVIVVLQSEDTQWHRVPVWADSVTPEQFSHLHFQIAFGAHPPKRRNLGALLRSLV
jgi:hypothetical protein